VSGEVLELVEMATYEEFLNEELLKVGDFVRTRHGRGVLIQIDQDDDSIPYFVGVFGSEGRWIEYDEEITFISRPDYGEVV